jgi:transposase
VETIAKLQNCRNQRIPVYISEEVFNELVLPYLVRNKRGSQPKVSYYKLFHYIIYILYTGCQWKMIPIDVGPDEKPEIHYTNIYRQWQKWVKNGSVENIFCNTINKLQSLGKLSLETIQIDGTNTVAKNGGDKTGYSGHKH